jgi:hypothetical protein
VDWHQAIGGVLLPPLLPSASGLNQSSGCISFMPEQRATSST